MRNFMQTITDAKVINLKYEQGHTSLQFFDRCETMETLQLMKDLNFLAKQLSNSICLMAIAYILHVKFV